MFFDPSFLIKILEFLVFVILAVFIPGYTILFRLKIESLTQKIFLSSAVGLVALTLVSYIAGYLKINSVIFIYIGVCLAIFLVKKLYKELEFGQILLLKDKLSLSILLLILAGTVFQAVPIIRSGWINDFGVGFWGPSGHDGIWHQALVNQLIKAVPPQNPAFSDTILSNYHYFYDLLVAATFNLSHIPIVDLIYRFYPILFSLLLGFGTYLLVKTITGSKVAALISLYFVYFSGSFGWIIDFIKGRQIGGESAFWANQPVSMNLNPPFAISLIIIIAIILLLKYSNKTSRVFYSLVLILLAGALIEFKVYAGIIALSGLFLLGLHQIIFRKTFLIFSNFIGSLILSLIIFLPQNSGAGSLIVFSPFWFIHTMIDFSDRVGWEKLSEARLAYFARSWWPKFVAVEVLGFAIFIIGNLGTRLISLFTLPNVFKNWQNREHFLIICMSVVAFTIPIFFIQKGTNWNTIQFFYYFMYFVTLFTGLAIINIYKKLPMIIAFPVIGFLFVITPISAFPTFLETLSATPPAMVGNGEIEALNFLKQQPDGTVLTYPYNKNFKNGMITPIPLYAYETTAYVSAFSEKVTYLDDLVQQDILQNNYSGRLAGTNNFFANLDSQVSRKFLDINEIKYIYLPKFFNTSINESSLNLKTIFENKAVKIYQRI